MFFIAITTSHTSMVLTEITCPICNTVNPISRVTQENEGGLSAWIASLKHSRGVEYPSYTITCSMCGTYYRYFEMHNYSWIRSRLLLSSNSIETFKIVTESCGNPIPCDEKAVLDWIFMHVVGIVRQRPRFLNIFFDVIEHRLCLSCFEERDFLSGIGVYKVY